MSELTGPQEIIARMLATKIPIGTIINDPQRPFMLRCWRAPDGRLSASAVLAVDNTDPRYLRYTFNRDAGATTGMRVFFNRPGIARVALGELDGFETDVPIMQLVTAIRTGKLQYFDAACCATARLLGYAKNGKSAFAAFVIRGTKQF